VVIGASRSLWSKVDRGSHGTIGVADAAEFFEGVGVGLSSGGDSAKGAKCDKKGEIKS
jgi:hypothetical protein